TLAKWLCGAPDRLDPPRMSGSYCGDGRAAPSPHPPVLPGVLQCGAYPPLIREGCAHSKGHSVRRAHRRSTRAWRTAPSIRTDLICDRDNPWHPCMALAVFVCWLYSGRVAETSLGQSHGQEEEAQSQTQANREEKQA